MTSLWRNLQYVSWLISDTSKGLASTLFGFAIPLIALMVTNDPAQAGIIGGVGAAVRVSLTLFGGVLADRHRRITLMVLGASVGVVLSVAFTALALGNALTFASLLVLDVLLAARTGLFDTAGESALKDLVASDTMGRAQAANQARDAALQLAGGPIGGALLVVGGWLVGAVMAVCHLISAVSAAAIPRLRGAAAVGTDADGTADAGAEDADGTADTHGTQDADGHANATDPTNATDPADAASSTTGWVSDAEGLPLLGESTASASGVSDVAPGLAASGLPSTSMSENVSGAASESPASAAADADFGAASNPAASATKPNALREIREGFAWLFSRPDLRGVLLILTIINLGVNTVMTTIVYALQQDGQSPAVIGWLSAGMGITMLLGALMATTLVSRVGTGMLMILGLVALVAGCTATIFTNDPWGIVLVLAVPGLLLAPLNAAMGGYFMVATPSELMGRASSAAGVFGMGAMPLAPLIAGFGLSLVGRTGTIVIGVALCAIAATMAVTNRPLRLLPAEAGWAKHAKQFEVSGHPITTP